jgi:lipoprotein-releasing system permease protein
MGDSRLEVATPVLDAPGTLFKGAENQPTLLRGLDFSTSEAIYDLESRLVEGRMPSNNEVILGVRLRDQLNIQLNDVLEIQFPLAGSHNVTVVGFFDFKVAAINERWAVSPLSTVQSFLNTNGVSSIEMQIKESYNF